MNAEAIFNNILVRKLEIEILDAQFIQEKNHYRDKSDQLVVSHLLRVRRNLLNDMFVMTNEYKSLLAEFNEHLSIAVQECACLAEDAYAQAWVNEREDVEVESKCFLGYGLSSIHPMQTIRAKKIWQLLSGCISDYDPMYKDGAMLARYKATGMGTELSDEQTNQLLYGCDTLDNWNEGLDLEMTKDMHLSMHFHHLFDHTLFSIFDLLWVRDFNFETHIEYDTSTRANMDEGDDVDWGKKDYYD